MAAHASCERSHVNGAGANIVTTSMSKLVLLLATAIICMGMVESRDCPADGLVYPLHSTCFHPAVYYGQEVYELGDQLLGNLAPEWDETNSTYYVRLAEDGAKYLFTHWTREYRFAVSQSERLVILNAETGRVLGWRQEGEEYFLVEQTSEPVIGGAADFMFSKVENVTLPCARIANARCEVYYILSFEDASVGLTAYVEDEVTYFKRSDASAAAPFVLFRSDIASTKPTAFSSPQPQAVVKDILPIV
ncbi:hypothetical protein L7F22_047353 [Adiantum nelumboides]|nr:hypothetical protein [Adiantum nelumboides]